MVYPVYPVHIVHPVYPVFLAKGLRARSQCVSEVVSEYPVVRDTSVSTVAFKNNWTWVKVEKK